MNSPADTDGHIARVTYLFGTQTTATAGTAPVDQAATPPADGREPSTEEKPRGLPRTKGFDSISNVSMHALARRDMSAYEMRAYLVGREFEPDAVDNEVDRLGSVGLIDEVRLAEAILRTCRERKGMGRSAVGMELRQRRIEREVIDAVVASLDDDELERATALAHKRAPQVRSLDATTARRRLSAFLQRKGYSGAVVAAAVRAALEPAGPQFR